MLEKSEHCQDCGLTEREFHEDPDAYAAVQVVCPWCAMRDRARASDETEKSIPGSRLKLLPARVAQKVASVKAERPQSRRERARGKKR